jgi:hypothetical protein
MDQGFRQGFTTAEKTALWDRCDIGRAGKNLVHIQHITLSSLAHLYTLSLPASRTSTGTKRDSWPMASIRMPSFGGSED